MQLSEKQLARFRSDGYLAIEGFFDRTEAEALRIELKRIYDTELESGTGINCAVQSDGTKRDNAGEKQNLQVIPLNNRSDLHKALPFHPRVVSVVEQLIGDEFMLELDQAFWKPPKVGVGTSWASRQRLFQNR